MVNGCKACLGVSVAVGEGVMEGVSVMGMEVAVAVGGTMVEVAGADRHAERIASRRKPIMDFRGIEELYRSRDTAALCPY